MPQVILIMTDTQRKDMLGCYGNPEMKTPCLDRLAGQGIRFDRAYCCQPVCGPARAALFTGTFPHSNGSWGNSMPLGQTILTVGQRLQRQGIPGAYIGKWHLDGGDYFGNGQCPDGWDPAFWYDMRNYLEELAPEERRASRRTELNRDPELTAEFTFGHRCSNRAIDFLKRHAGQDFLLVLSYDEPHGPFVCPPPYSRMYKDYRFPKGPAVWDRLEGKPEHQKVWAGGALQADKDAMQIHQPDFFGCNSFVDAEIGRVLQAIDHHAPQALILYTSDHGDFLGHHSLGGKGPAMYDDITNIPFLVRWPGHSPAGTVSPHPVSHIDVTPTILAAFGQPVPGGLEGRSLLPALHDPQARVNEAIFMEFGRYEIDHDGFGGFQPIRAVFDGRWKLVINLLGTDELYDLQTDPSEMNNLIAPGNAPAPGTAEARDRLHDRLLTWMNDTRDPFRGYYWHRRPWRTDAPPATWDYTHMTRQRVTDPPEPHQLDYDTGLPITEYVRKK